MSFIPKNELKGMRVIAALMLLLVGVFLFCGLTGYRLLDIFSSGEWEREGPGTHTTGSHHYFHK